MLLEQYQSYQVNSVAGSFQSRHGVGVLHVNCRHTIDRHDDVIQSINSKLSAVKIDETMTVTSN